MDLAKKKLKCILPALNLDTLLLAALQEFYTNQEKTPTTFLNN